MGWNAPPPAVNYTSGDVGTLRRDGAMGWGGGSRVEERADKAGRCQSPTDDTELVVDPNWLAAKWFTTSPLSMATAWAVACLARNSAVALAWTACRTSTCLAFSSAAF
jgi:hypothetical protein